MTPEERRIASTIYRVLTNQDEAQYRALDRLKALAGEVVAYELWLKTNPDPVIVEAVLTYCLLSSSPLRNVLSPCASLTIPVTLTRTVTP